MRLGQSPAVLKRHVTSHVLWTWPLTWHFYCFLGCYSFSCVPCTLDMAVSKPRLPPFGPMPHVAASRLGALRLRDETLSYESPYIAALCPPLARRGGVVPTRTTTAPGP